MHDLLRHQGTGKQIELMIEKGVYTMQTSKSSDSFVIEIADDHDSLAGKCPPPGQGNDDWVTLSIFI